MKTRLTRLFVLGIAFLAMSSLALAQTRPNMGRYEGTVRQYAWRDVADPPVPGCSLFVGSSSFALWGKKLEAAFAEYEAVNRGFGGSVIAQNIVALDRIHLPYQPSRVVMFCGTNDIAGGADVEVVFKNFKYYAARHWNEDPLREIYFVTPSHAPVREKFWPKGDELCEKINKAM